MWVVLALTLAVAPVAVDPPYYTYGGRPEPPAEILALVPRDYELFDFVTGDLNADAREDAILVLRKGDVPLGTFDYDKGRNADKKKWRVVAARARFYDQPDLKSTPRRAYVVKGDTVEGYYETRHFVNVTFTNGDGDSTNGFLLKKDIEPAEGFNR